MQIVSTEPVGPDPGAILRAARHRKGLTQRAAGRLCGIAPSVFSDYERGARDPSLGTLRRLLHGLGFDVALTLVRRVTDDTQLGGPLGALVLRHQDQLVEALLAIGATRVWVVGRVVEGDEGPDDGIRFQVDVPSERFTDAYGAIMDVLGPVPFFLDTVDPRLRSVDEALLLPEPPYVELTDLSTD